MRFGKGHSAKARRAFRLRADASAVARPRGGAKEALQREVGDQQSGTPQAKLNSAARPGVVRAGGWPRSPGALRPKDRADPPRP